MPPISILALAALSGLPQVTIADEHREMGDPTEIKITLSNKTKNAIFISFQPDWYMDYFVYHFFDERGRPVKLKYTEGPQDTLSPKLVKWLDPGQSVTGYLSPKIDYVIPPGRYQVEVVYFHREPARNGPQEITSNRITKTFL